MSPINWHNIKNQQMFIKSLGNFLLNVFEEEFLREGVKKLEI